MLPYTPIEEQDGDILTKALSRGIFKFHKCRIGVVQYPYLAKRECQKLQQERLNLTCDLVKFSNSIFHIRRMTWMVGKLCDMALSTIQLSKFELWAKSRVVHVVIAKIQQSSLVVFILTQLTKLKPLVESVEGQLGSRTIVNSLISYLASQSAKNSPYMHGVLILQLEWRKMHIVIINCILVQCRALEVKKVNHSIGIVQE